MSNIKRGVADQILERLDTLDQSVQEMKSQLRRLVKAERHHERQEEWRDELMAHTASEVLEAVRQQTTVTDSLGVFVQQLKDQLAAQGVDQAAIDAAFEGVTANTAKEAVFQNTPTPAPSV